MYKSLLLIACFLWSISGNALKPSSKYEAIPDTLKLPFEKNTITTPDNIKLKSWTFLPAKDADNHTSVVLAYADAGNMSWWLGQAAILSQVGFTVIMFDYRGFGESDSFTIDPKMLYYNEFATDLTAVFNFAREKYPANKTGVWAFSMGTIVTTLAAREIKPDFIIGEGFVTDPELLKTFYAEKNSEILLPPGTSDYVKALKNIKAPMLIFSGKEDQVTTDEAVKKLKKIKPAIKVVNFKGGHMQGFSVMSKEYLGSAYVHEIERFLKII